MHTPEERFLTSLRSLTDLGSPFSIDKEASDNKEAAQTEEGTESSEKAEDVSEVVSEGQTKLADMSLDALMEDPNFLRGVTDRVAQRGHEIEAAVGRYLMTE